MTDTFERADAAGVAADPHEYLQADPHLGPLVDQHGELTVEPHDDPFERLVVSIIRQQVSMASANAIRERVFEQFDITPGALAAAERDALKDAGLSSQKAEYVKNVAEAHLENGYGPDYFAGMDDAAVLDELTDIKGVGQWTGKMYLLFCLGRADVFPVEDLGIRKGMWALYHEDMSRGEMREAAEKWQPYRSYASRYVWRAYEG